MNTPGAKPALQHGSQDAGQFNIFGATATWKHMPDISPKSATVLKARQAESSLSKWSTNQREVLLLLIEYHRPRLGGRWACGRGSPDAGIWRR